MRRGDLRPFLWLAPLLVGGCNLIFGIHGGDATTSGTTVTGGGGTGGKGTGGTGRGTGGGTGGTGTGGAGACPAARIVACDADGGVCTPTRIATDTDANDLRVQGDSVYFTTGDGDHVHWMRYDGTSGVDIASDHSTDHLTLAAGHLYWTDYYGGSVVKGCDLTGNALTTVAVMDPAAQIGNFHIAADPTATWVYWTAYSPTGVYRTLADGSHQTPTVVIGKDAALHVDAPTGVAVDATYLYWGDSDGIRRMKIADIGKSPPVLEDFSIDMYASVRNVVLDEARVYWVTYTGDVRSKAKTDPPGQQPLFHQTGSTSDILNLTVDDTHVYWITVDGNVYKTTKGGATVIHVASGPALQADGAGGMDTDCGAIYWAVPATGTSPGMVFRAAKGP